MGIQPGQYDRQIIERTIKLINGYKGVYNITLLMNSLLSLIVLPKEKSQFRRMNFLSSHIDDVEIINGIINKEGFYFDEGFIPKSVVRYPRNLSQLLRHIRNGISHQQIEPISENDKWVGVIIRDVYNHHISLEITFTNKELKDFALYIATSFLAEL